MSYSAWNDLTGGQGLSITARNPDGPIVVRKYGGSSLADIPRLRDVAADLRTAREAGQHLVVVVSAMGDQTDQLLRLAQAANPEPPRRELDMLLSVGERMSMALLCMALSAAGVPALSLTGSQVGIITDASHTDARIREVRAYRIREALAAGQVVVVAGFQGYCDLTREITTLGRGGSDTTAVALAHALGAERCEILKDVPGVMTADPKLLPQERRLERLTYEEMQTIAATGCGVVHPRAVAYATRHQVPLYGGSSFQAGPGTMIDTPSVPELPPPSGLRAIALTVARDQGRLLLSCPSQASRTLLQLALRAAATGPLTAEWLQGGDRWQWEGWGAAAALNPVATAASNLEATDEQALEVSWQTGQAAVSLAGCRPESWSGALQELRHRLAARDLADAPLRTDGDLVRLLVPQACLPDLLPDLHDLLEQG